MEDFLRAQWFAPDCVFAGTTTRGMPGRSLAPFDCFNLGDHVGDASDTVAANRAALRAALSLPAEPLWLKQVHGVHVVDADALSDGAMPEADAAVTRRADRVLAIQTADCLPVVFAVDDGSVIGAAHAGWRGLAAGVLESTVLAMGREPGRITAWIGPHIRQDAFEVGPEVRAAFIANDAHADQAFKPSNRAGRFMADLTLLARRRLQSIGMTHIDDCGHCSHARAKDFYSYRRDGNTGRMATLIWIGRVHRSQSVGLAD